MIEELLQQIRQRETDSAEYRKASEQQAQEACRAADKGYDEAMAKVKALVKEDRANKLQQAIAAADAEYQRTMAHTAEQCDALRQQLELTIDQLAQDLLEDLLRGDC